MQKTTERVCLKIIIKYYLKESEPRKFLQTEIPLWNGDSIQVKPIGEIPKNFEKKILSFGNLKFEPVPPLAPKKIPIGEILKILKKNFGVRPPDLIARSLLLYYIFVLVSSIKFSIWELFFGTAIAGSRSRANRRDSPYSKTHANRVGIPYAGSIPHANIPIAGAMPI